MLQGSEMACMTPTVSSLLPASRLAGVSALQTPTSQRLISRDWQHAAASISGSLQALPRCSDLPETRHSADAPGGGGATRPSTAPGAHRDAGGTNAALQLHRSTSLVHSASADPVAMPSAEAEDVAAQAASDSCDVSRSNLLGPWRQPALQTAPQSTADEEHFSDTRSPGGSETSSGFHDM